MKSFLIAFTTLALSFVADGQVNYTYTGNIFASIQGTVPQNAHVTISITLPAALDVRLSDSLITPTAWIMSDGIATLSSSKDSLLAVVSTDPTGAIIAWNLVANNNTGLTIVSCLASSQCNADSTNQLASGAISPYSARISFFPGTWVTSNAPPPTAGSQFFTHIADGGGTDTWQTDLLLVNPTSNTATASIRFHLDSPATSINIASPNLGPVTSIENIIIPPNVSVLYRTKGSNSVVLVTGWAEIVSTTTLSGQALFRRHAVDGNYYEGPVPVTPAVTTFTIPYDGTSYANSNGTIIANFSTAVAITNATPNVTANITCTAYDTQGNVLGVGLPLLTSVNGLQHAQLILQNTLPIGQNRGIAVCNSTQPVGVLALHVFGNFAISYLPLITR